MSILRLAIWDLSGRFAHYLVIFIIGIVFTRLLSPAEFGAFGIVLSVIIISSIFVDLGFRSAIIQFQDTSQEQLSTIFYLSLFFAFVLILIMFLVSDSIESFYQIDSLSKYINATSVIFILHAMTVIPAGLLQKKMALKSISIISTVSAILSGTIAITLAYLDYKIWALIIQQIASSLFIFIGNTYLTEWFPSFYFRLASIKQMWQFSSKLVLSGLLESIFLRLDVFIIGKIFSIEAVGYYNRAQSLDGLLKSFSSGTTTSVVFPLFAKMQKDVEKTQNYYKRSLNFISFLSFFLIGILFLASTDIVIILFTEKWIVVADYFRIMSATSFVYPINALMVNLITANGNTKALLRLEIIKKCILVPTYFTFLFGGIYYFLIALGAAFLFSLVANAVYVKKEIAISLKEQFRIIFSYGSITVCGIIIVFAAISFIHNLYLHFIVASFAFSAFYLLISYKLKLPGFNEVFNRLITFYENKRHAKSSPLKQ